MQPRRTKADLLSRRPERQQFLKGRAGLCRLDAEGDQESVPHPSFDCSITAIVRIHERWRCNHRTNVGASGYSAVDGPTDALIPEVIGTRSPSGDSDGCSGDAHLLTVTWL
jgi:hypothetical protein